MKSKGWLGIPPHHGTLYSKKMPRCLRASFQLHERLSTRPNDDRDDALRPPGNRKRNGESAVEVSGRNVRRLRLPVPVDVAVGVSTMSQRQLHRRGRRVQRRQAEGGPHQTKVRATVSPRNIYTPIGKAGSR